MQVEFKTEKGTLLFIKVPDESKSHLISKEYLGCEWLEYPDSSGCTKIPLPKGNWQLIGLTSEVTEEQSKMIVDNVRVLLFDKYKDYSKDLFFSNPLDSFKSLMQHLKVYEVNPYENIEEKYFYQRKDEGQSWGDYFVKERIKSQENVGKWIVLFKSNSL